ncbi:hypothetical protein ACFSTC_06445 [Nonomuraea ferruginea]
MSTLPKASTADLTIARAPSGGGDVVGAGYRLPAVLGDQLCHLGGGARRGAGAVERAAEVVDDHLGAALGQQQRV